MSKKPTHYDRAMEFHEASLRIEKAIYLAGALIATHALPDDLEELIDDDPECLKCLGIPQDIWDEQEAAGCRLGMEIVAEYLLDHRKLGFLLHAATPVMQPTSATSRSYSWGHYRTTWVYGETLDEAFAQAFAWVTECRKKEDAEAAAAVVTDNAPA